MFDSASIFLQTCLQIPNSWALPVPVSMNLMCPPWYFELYQQRSSRRKQEQAAKKANGAPTKDSSATNGAQDKLAAGFNGDEIGMTAERQRVIQASLFKMLGQADGPADDEEPASKPAAKADETEQPPSAGNA